MFLILLLFLLLPASAGAYPNLNQAGDGITVLNDATTGTILNTLTSLTSASPSKAVITPLSATSGVLGITVAGAGTANAALIQTAGQTNCLFDGATTAGDYFIASSSNAGYCHDSGSTSPVGSSLGIVTSTNAAAGTYTVVLQISGVQGTSQPINLLPSQSGSYNAQNQSFTNLKTLNGVLYATDLTCDGATDQATALQNDLNAACNGSQTGIVYIPAACYGASGHQLLISSTVTIPRQCQLIGLGGPAQAAGGTRAVEIDYNGTGGDAITTNNTVANNGIGVKNLRIKNTGTGVNGLSLYGIFNSIVDGVLVDGVFSGAGIYIAPSTTSSVNNDTIQNTQSYQNVYGIELDGSSTSARNIGSVSFINDAFITSTTYNLYILGFDASNYTVNTLSFVGGNIAEGANTNIKCVNGSSIFFNNTFIENVNEAFDLTNCVDITSRATNVAASGLTTYPIVADNKSTYDIELNKRSNWGFILSNMRKRDAYDELTAMQDPTGQVGWGQITNLAKDSEDFTTASWTTGGTVTSRTANAAAAPNGASTATQVVNGSGGSLRQTISVGSAVGTRCWEGSVWVQAASGIFNGFTANITDTPTGTTLGTGSANISTKWQRLIFRGCGTGDTDTSIVFRPVSAASNTTFNLWGAQVHELPSVPQVATATTYQKTAGTAMTSTSVGLTTPLLQGTEASAPTGFGGADQLWPDSTDHRWKMLNNNGTATDVTGISDLHQTLSFSGALGGLTSTAATTLLQTCIKAKQAGTFADLHCTTDLNGGSCTTAPTYNIRNNTGGTTGTALACANTAISTDQAETLSYAAGDEICLVRTVNGGTCTTPVFNVTAN